jgi:anti-anti-sigma factor
MRPIHAHEDGALEVVSETLGQDVTKVALIGRLDIAGAAKIDLKLSLIAGSHQNVIFDMTEVPFIASMGIRTLVMCAKTIKSKGGRVVIVHPTEDVHNVLTVSGIDEIIPIAPDVDAALAAVTAA